jgi:hypothetical protein
MLRRTTGRFALGVVLIAVLGCKSHPELSKTNSEGSAEWKKWGGQSQLITFTIAAANRIDTPAGEKYQVLAVVCDGSFPSFSVNVGTPVDSENGDVSMSFNDADLAKQQWEPKTRDLKQRRVYYMEVPESELPGFVRQLRQASTFQFEFTPKGGKAQRSRFNLLNINSLLDQEENCKKPLSRLQ